MRRLFLLLLILGCANAIMIPLSEVRMNGTVYADLNADGMWDEGELGLQYIQIHVVDENDTLVGHTTTDENGYYRTTISCVHGTMLWVTVVAPEGMSHTRDESYEFSCRDGGSIYSLFGLGGTGCAWDYDCADDEHCTSGLCRPVTCGEGYYPHNHECIPVPECTSPSDCPANETCEAFECVPLYCAGLEGYEIVNHKCYPVEEEVPEEVPECAQNEDCAFDEMCSAGSCVKVVCPEGYKLENHYCIYVPEEKPPEEEVPEEKPPEKEEEPEKEVIPEEPEENATIAIPEEEKPVGQAEEEGIPAMVIAAFIIAAAVIIVTYTTLYKK